ncbi:MAG TPA: hypothetical protein PK013_05020, partial [Thermosynergistes sp.]|nr:hypothetical protein [Thermosynergistes sp.]
NNSWKLGHSLERDNLKDTDSDVTYKLLEAWDKVAARECEANHMFKKIYESQKAWASKYVPYRTRIYPPYSLIADYYWKK